MQFAKADSFLVESSEQAMPQTKVVKLWLHRGELFPGWPAICFHTCDPRLFELALCVRLALGGVGLATNFAQLCFPFPVKLEVVRDIPAQNLLAAKRGPELRPGIWGNLSMVTIPRTSGFPRERFHGTRLRLDGAQGFSSI